MAGLRSDGPWPTLSVLARSPLHPEKLAPAEPLMVFVGDAATLARLERFCPLRHFFGSASPKFVLAAANRPGQSPLRPAFHLIPWRTIRIFGPFRSLPLNSSPEWLCIVPNLVVGSSGWLAMARAICFACLPNLTKG